MLEYPNLASSKQDFYELKRLAQTSEFYDNDYLAQVYGSKLIEDLRTVGVQGFGIESGNCIHLDYRCGEICPDKDKYGVYIVFSWAKVTGSVVYNRK